MKASASRDTMPAPERIPTAVEGLLDALASERRLLGELAAVMRRQREAVLGDDLEAVDASVYAAHRVLRTLNEARRRRHSLSRALGQPDDLDIGKLQALVGDPLSASLHAARNDLRQTAEALSREVEVNRQVLRRALGTARDRPSAIPPVPERKLLCAGSGPEL